MTTYLLDSDGEVVEVHEETTLGVDFALYDEAGDPVTPTSLAWTLTDQAGNTINSRADVAIDPAVASGTILLEGDDLALQAGETGRYAWRIVTLVAAYNSDLGSGLALIEEVWFRVLNLVNV